MIAEMQQATVQKQMDFFSQDSHRRGSNNAGSCSFDSTYHIMIFME